VSAVWMGRHRELLGAGVGRVRWARTSATSVLFAVALIAAVLVPDVGYYGLLLLLLERPTSKALTFLRDRSARPRGTA
jgi:hypothetical protein